MDGSEPDDYAKRRQDGRNAAGAGRDGHIFYGSPEAGECPPLGPDKGSFVEDLSVCPVEVVQNPVGFVGTY